MSCAWRVLAAALLCGSLAAAGAQELRLRQPDGKVVTVIDDQGVGGPLLQWIERRNPDGSFDLGFGRSGRASFSLSTDLLEPRSLGIDAQGRLILAGAARAGAAPSTAVVSRFLPDGRADARWGKRGTSRVASAGGSTQAVDALTMPDQGMLLLGQVDAAGTRRAVLWRLHPDGSADAAFGQGGESRLGPLDGAQPTGLRQDEDGSVLIASQRPQAGGLLLEVHRWRLMSDGPRRVARQPAPRDWRGPVTLDRRNGTWQWVDAAATGALPLVFTDDVDAPAASMAPVTINPFAVEEATSRPAPMPTAAHSMATVWLWLATVPLLLGLAAWRSRAARATHFGAADAQATWVVSALSELELASAATVTERPCPAEAAIPAEAAARGGRDAPAQPALGPPDDLKRIKGIGPVLEQRLHREGIYYFRQIARWRPEDVSAVAARLSAFRDRITRDRWVDQAIELAR